MLQHCRNCGRALAVGGICACVVIVAADVVERAYIHPDQPHAVNVGPYIIPDQPHGHTEQGAADSAHLPGWAERQ
jgi:hypothetical protein